MKFFDEKVSNPSNDEEMIGWSLLKIKTKREF